ncbi:MAG: transporter substrate-binding domain-containing protein [Deltaproteobacteria bacterium]|nr:transporter substrate-binding domain-containing protein [Deltaproteobacteria bacterium]
MGRPAHILIVIISLLFCANAFASEPIKVSSTVYPSFSQPNVIPGRGNGVLYDLTVEAFKAADSEVKIDFVPMARIVWSVVEKKHHATLGVIEWFAKDQKDHLVETVELINANIVFFFKRERFPDGLSYEKLSDLKKYKIGSLIGSSTLPLFEKAGINAELVAELEQNFKKLNLGRIDLTVAIDLTGWNIIKDLFPDSANNFSTVKKPLIQLKTGLIFHKEQHDSLQTFKKGLDIILKNGTYHEIVERYYGKERAFDDVLPQAICGKMKEKP